MEMLNTGFVQQDGVSYISSGVFESMRLHDRVAMTKAGCLPGFRTDIVLVPTLRLGLFAAVASTCDSRGDGDAVAHPMAFNLIRRVSLLLETADTHHAPLFMSELENYYCDPTSAKAAVKVEGLNPFRPSRRLLFHELQGDNHTYVMEVVPGTHDVFKLNMGDGVSQFRPAHSPGCERSAHPRQNLCPISCNLRMGRGDGAYVQVERQGRRVLGLTLLGGGQSFTVCRQPPPLVAEFLRST